MPFNTEIFFNTETATFPACCHCCVIKANIMYKV